MVRTGHIVDTILKVRAGKLGCVVCEIASIRQKFEYVYRNCHSFLIVLSYRNNLKNLDSKE